MVFFSLYDNKTINIDCPLILDLILIISDTHFFNTLTTFLNLKTPYIGDYNLNH